ncbi:MAG: tape measure protein, partial [Bacteroidales bacterium]
MADNGIGSSLVISEDVFKNIDRAEESVKSLEKTTEKAATNITASFRAMADGVNPFIEQLSKARKLVEGLDLSNTGASKAYSDIDNLSNSLAKTKDEAEKAANAMVIVGKEVDRVNKLKEARETTLIDRKLQESYDKQIQRELDVLKLREKQEYKEVERQVLLERQKHEATQKEINDSALVDRILSEQQQRKINREIEIAKLREQQQKAEVENLLFLEKKREETAKKEKQMFLGTYTGSMNMEENSINQRIAKIKQLQIARDSLSKTDADYKVRLDALNDSIKRLNRENAVAISGSKELQEQHGRLLNTSDQLMRKLALVFSVSQISGYVTKMVEVRGEFELQNKALAAILQNKEQADQLFDKITKLAVQSPFQLKELVTYTKQLAAYRVETEKLFDTTKMLADISAGLGVDMNRLILAYGQVKAANYLRGTELRQFSEAGINILGELSSYFTELEGNIVSVGDVFERVSKRMVKFSDVEVIFKKMTSEGGIFYKMQEQQAETIAGQLSNLRDSISVTMDEIGKANEGSIKGVLSSIRTLASNWETVANVINTAAIGFALYTAKTLLAASANKAFTASAIESTIASGGLTSALAKTKIMMTDLGKFAKSNIFLIIASGVAMLGMELWDHIKSVDALKEKYDILSISLGKQKSEITNIIKNLKEQSDILESSSKNMSSLSKETEDYTKEQSRNNEAQKKQNALLQDLKTKHPEIYAGLSKQKDGTIDLTKAQNELNSQLERTNYLNFLAKQTDGYFSKGLIQNLETINQQQIDFNKATNDTNNAWVQLSGKVGAIMDSSKDVSHETKKAFLDIAESGLSSSEKLGKTLRLLFNDTSKLRVEFFNLANSAVSSYSNMIKASDDLNKTQSELIKTISSISQDFKRSYDSATKDGEKAAQNTLKVFLESLNIQEQAVIDFVTKRFEVEIGIKLPETTLVKEYSGMQKRIKEYVEKKGFSIDLIQADQSETEYFEKLSEDLKIANTQIDQLTKASEQLNASITNKDALEKAKKKKEELQDILKAYGRPVEKKQEENKRLKILKDQIDLIKKSNIEYEKLIKNYDKETAKIKIKNSYQEAFNKFGIGDAIMSMDFDKSGAIKAIKDLKNIAGEAGNKELTKSLTDISAEVDIDVQVKGRDRLNKEIESMFGGYEL